MDLGEADQGYIKSEHIFKSRVAMNFSMTILFYVINESSCLLGRDLLCTGWSDGVVP
jgi:hypothetical protein